MVALFHETTADAAKMEFYTSIFAVRAAIELKFGDVKQG